MTFPSTLARAWAVCTVCIAAWVQAAWAAPLPSSLSIDATAAVDTTNSSSTGTASSTADTSKLLGGVASTPSPFTTAIFTSTGDAIRGAYVLKGGPRDAETARFIDFSFALANTSATDTYELDFAFLAELNATASGGNAFSLNDLSVRDAANNEVFFAFANADTANTINNGSGQGTTNPFSIVLAPGANTSFTALLRHYGGSSGNDGQYGADASLSILLQDVRVAGGPIPVPTPVTLALVLLALPLLGITRRAR